MDFLTGPAFLAGAHHTHASGLAGVDDVCSAVSKLPFTSAPSLGQLLPGPVWSIFLRYSVSSDQPLSKVIVWEFWID